MTIDRRRSGFLGLACLLALCGAVGLAGIDAARASDRHIGYYYPDPDSHEIYDLRAPVLPGANRRRRVGFVTAITNNQVGRRYAPGYFLLAKGGNAEKLIVTGVSEGRFNTLFRMRALLAALSAVARATPLFQEQSLQEYLTFLDLCGMLGFTQVTVTDGDKFAHQIKLIRGATPTSR